MKRCKTWGDVNNLERHIRSLKCRRCGKPAYWMVEFFSGPNLRVADMARLLVCQECLPYYENHFHVIRKESSGIEERRAELTAARMMLECMHDFRYIR